MLVYDCSEMLPSLRLLANISPLPNRVSNLKPAACVASQRFQKLIQDAYQHDNLEHLLILQLVATQMYQLVHA